MTYQHSKTSNGINVVTYSMPHISSVAANIIIKVGSRYESIDEAGISHFLEHMAFKGTGNKTAAQIAQEFDLIGGRFNAYTGKENTVYYTKVLAQHLNQGLSIMADILQNSLFDPQEISRELGVITQEIMEVHDNPDDLAHEKFYELAYAGQPLGRSILGTVDSISKYTTESFQNYIEKHYTSENIVISLAGKINHEEAVSLIESLFYKIKPGKKTAGYQKAQYIGGYHFTQKELEQTTITLGFEGVSYSETEPFYHAQILSIILGGGFSSRLFQSIREKLGLAYSVGSWLNSYSDSGIFSIYAATDHSKANDVLINICNEVKKITNHIPEAELSRAKAQIEANIYMAEEKPEYKSEEIGKNYLLFKRYLPASEVMEVISATTIRDLQNMAERIFSTKITASVVGAHKSSVDFNIIDKNLLSN